MKDAVGDIEVAIILVNWNSWADCLECIDSILGMRHQATTIFVVDNASVDNSIEHITEWCSSPAPIAPSSMRPGVCSGTSKFRLQSVPMVEIDYATSAGRSEEHRNYKVVLVRSGGNLGFAGGNNVGIMCAGLARYEYFWLLNTDTVVKADALTDLINRARADVRLGIVGSTLAYFSSPNQVQASGGGAFDAARMRPHHLGQGMAVADISADPAAIEAKTAYVVGASMLVRREFVRDVGLMAEDYFLYFEELDWAVRGYGRYRMGYAPTSIVYHKVGGSSAQVASFFSAKTQYVSRLKFVARYFPQRYSALIFQMLFDELPRHCFRRRWNQARALLTSISSFRVAFADGVAGRPRDIPDTGVVASFLHARAEVPDSM